MNSAPTAIGRHRLAHPQMRLQIGLALSLLLHAVLLSLQFGIPGIGLPSIEAPWTTRRAHPQDLSVVLAPSGPAAAPPAPAPAPAPEMPVAGPSPLPLPPSRPSDGSLQLVPERRPDEALRPEIVTPVKPKVQRKKTPVAQRKPPRPPSQRKLITSRDPHDAAFAVTPPDPDLPAQQATVPEDEPDAVPSDTTPATPDSAPVAQAVVPDATAIDTAEQEVATRQAMHEQQEREAQQQAESTQVALAAEKKAAELQAAQAAAERAARASEAEAQAAEARAAEARMAEQRAAQARQLDEQAARQQAAQREADALARQQEQQARADRAASLERERKEAERLALEQQRLAETERQRLAEQEAQQAQRMKEQADLLRRQEADALAARNRELEIARQDALRQEALQRQAEQAAARQREQERERFDQAGARAAAARNAAAAPSADTSSNSSSSVSATAALPRGFTGGGLAARALEQARNPDLLRPEPRGGDEARPAPGELASAPRRSVFGSNDHDVGLRMYIDSWRLKIERNGSLNYAQSSRDKARGDPVLTVMIRSDGTLEDIVVNRSSGRPDLDEAARRIVRINARYAPFPPALARKYDVIEIRRIWNFGDSLLLQEEVR